MPFYKPPNPALRQWDDYACDAAIVAQLLHMGGKLDIPFGTAAFDRRIGRAPGQPNRTYGGVQLVADTLPVRLLSFMPMSLQDQAKPASMRKRLQSARFRDEDIEAYLRGSEYRHFQESLGDIQRFQAGLVRRGQYRQIVTPTSSPRMGELLRRGAAIVTTYDVSISMSHAVMLVKSEGRHNGADVTLYNPSRRHGGISHHSLRELLRSRYITPDTSGFVAYIMP